MRLPSKSVACSIVSSNYLAQGRVLAESLKATNPDLDFVLLILDFDGKATTGEMVGFQTVGLDFLEDKERLVRMQMIYDVVEFATAVKPYLLRSLIAGGYEVALYFDPDILVCSDVSDLIDRTRSGEILLTPHALSPYPRDGLSPSELDIMRAGIFNLGFIGVSASAGNFLDWWAERLESQSKIAPESGLFTDQRWIDWVPSLFPSSVEKSPGANVAYWNLHERKLELIEPLGSARASEPGELAIDLGKKISVNGEPLIFFHFSGYSPLRSSSISRHFFGNHRVSLADGKVISAIFKAYARALRARGFEKASRNETHRIWEIDGVDYGPEIRAFLSEEWVPRYGETLTFPDPEMERDQFFSYFLTNQVGQSNHRSRSADGVIYKFLRSIQREGAINTLPKVSQAISSRIRARVQRIKAADSPVDLGEEHRRRQNLCLVTYSEQDFSLGVVGNRIQKLLNRTGYNSETWSRPKNGGEWSWTHTFSGTESTRENLILVANADRTPTVLEELPERVKAGRKRIGYWFWEVANVPVRTFARAEALVDEVWVATEFIAQALRPVLEVPVVRAPLQLFEPERHGFSDFEPLQGRGSGFTYLATGDFGSVPNRKNLVGVVRAFRSAFPVERECRLVLKVSSPSSTKQAIHGMLELRDEIGNRSDIEIIEERLTSEEMDSLFRSSNVFVSLHRAEGLGLNIADAASFGLPIISTGYGGCLDFLSPESFLNVDFRLKRIAAGSEPYSPFGVWAEPDLDEASSHMRFAFSNYEEALDLGRIAKTRMVDNFNEEVIGEIWRGLL